MRWQAKQQKLLLIAYWVHWARWHRRRKCWLFNLQTKFRQRWIIANWRQAVGLIKQRKQHAQYAACWYVQDAISQSCDRVRMRRHLERKGEAFRATMRRFQVFLETYQRQARHKRMKQALQNWQTHVIPAPVKITPVEARKLQTERRRVEWAARIAITHRAQTQNQRRLQAKKTVSHRPAWK